MDKKYDIFKIVIFNALMLLFGYLGETGVISKYIGIPLGFIFFIVLFINLKNRNFHYRNTPLGWFLTNT